MNQVFLGFKEIRDYLGLKDPLVNVVLVVLAVKY
jgi:hypothetical protein